MDEAEAILGVPALADVAGRYRTLADGWHTLAAAALPDTIPVFHQARALRHAREDAFRQGPDGAATVARVDSELITLEQGVADSFPLNDVAARDLLEDLRERLTVLHAEEVAAMEMLQQIVA